ncbi:MAG: hypothetical protein IBX67_04680 [Dehalococcoidia bacterium]|nr:hypothetical protein [Dehalococcoidia bacterium]
MPLAGYEAILVLAGFFLLLGIIFVIWNKRERGKYYNSILLTRRDVKESLTHEPERPWLHAWQIGGRISLIVGIVLLIIGVILWLIAY